MIAWITAHWKLLSAGAAMFVAGVGYIEAVDTRFDAVETGQLSAQAERNYIRGDIDMLMCMILKHHHQEDPVDCLDNR